MQNTSHKLRRPHLPATFAILSFGVATVLFSADAISVASSSAPQDIAKQHEVDITAQKAFEEKTKMLSEQIKGPWNRKEWPTAVSLIKACLKEYYDLPSPAQKEYHLLAMNLAYNLACALSLDGKPDDAMFALRQSVEKFGYSSYATMKQDTDLDSLRTRADFIALQEKVREVGDYPYILKSVAGYPMQPDKSVPKVAYQSKDAKELKDLRERYHLDKIAGNGDEVSRLKNLMLWVNRQVEHDGSSNPPPKRNAPALLDAAKQEKHGLNCRMMSTVLNDVLLAEGFATRHVTCMPKNPDDPDCHVINLVYCRSLAKWVWMDASFAGYWTDDKNTLLSIQEVRDRIRSGNPIHAALTLHHNAERYTQTDYLDYMTKNLYWFLTPIESRFDYETSGKPRYVALVPPGDKHGWIGNTYYTSDSTTFWQKP